MLEKICEKLPFGITLYARDFGYKHPICCYSFDEHGCKYLRKRKSRLARFMVKYKLSLRLYECSKKEVKSDEKKGES